MAHVLLIYDDMSNGRSLEYRFLVDGLSKGERCVYATYRYPQKWSRTWSKMGLLLTTLRPRISSTSTRLKTLFKMQTKWTTNVRRIIERIMTESPDRIVSWRWIRDIDGGEQNLANRQVEQMVNAAIRGDVTDPNYSGIKNFPGLFVGTYLVRGITHNEPWAWPTNLLANHDTTIFAGGEGTRVPGEPEQKGNFLN